MYTLWLINKADLPVLLSKATIQHGIKPRHCPVCISTNVRRMGGSIRLWFNVQRSWGNRRQHCACFFDSGTERAIGGWVVSLWMLFIDESDGFWVCLLHRMDSVRWKAKWRPSVCHRSPGSCDSVPESRRTSEHVALHHSVQGTSWTHSQWTHKSVRLLLNQCVIVPCVHVLILTSIYVL